MKLPLSSTTLEKLGITTGKLSKTMMAAMNLWGQAGDRINACGRSQKGVRALPIWRPAPELTDFFLSQAAQVSNHYHYLSQLCVCPTKRCKEENSASSSCWSQGWAHSGYFRHSTQQWPLCFQECDLSHTDTNPHESSEPCIYISSTGLRVTMITYSEMVQSDH